MKRKILCGTCIALILALSLCILAAATRMNRDTPMDSTTQNPNDTSILEGITGNNGLLDPNGTGDNNRLPDGNIGGGAPDGTMGNGVTNNGGNDNNSMAGNAGNGTNNGGNAGNGMTDNGGTNNGGTTDNGGNTTESTPMDSLLPETNVPDADIGGAVGDNDGDAIPDAVDSDDDNDGLRDPVDSDANGDNVNDDDKTTGIVGIVLAVIVVIAVIIVIIAVVPKKPKDS